MSTLRPIETSNLFLDSPTLSLLEKRLLQLGWRVETFTAPHDGRCMTRALAPASGALGGWVSYPHPAYHYHGQDRRGDLHRALADLALVLQRQGRNATPESLALELPAAVAAPPQGFSCTRCGTCCIRMPDAYQGRVSVEEVQTWERLGLTRILRFISRVERSDYTLYKAWPHPATGRYLPRCPWHTRSRQGHSLCRIHAYRPLKCRSFPLHAGHASGFGCPGLQPILAAAVHRPS